MELKTPLRVADQGFGLSYFWIEDADGNMVADNGEDGKCEPIMSRDTARRFVACVNALAGFNLRAIEGEDGPTVMQMFAILVGQRDQLRSERDTLLSLLKENRKHGIAYTTAIESTGDSFDFEDWAKRVDAAISAVEQAP